MSNAKKASSNVRNFMKTYLDLTDINKERLR